MMMTFTTPTRFCRGEAPRSRTRLRFGRRGSAAVDEFEVVEC